MENSMDNMHTDIRVQRVYTSNCIKNLGLAFLW